MYKIEYFKEYLFEIPLKPEFELGVVRIKKKMKMGNYVGIDYINFLPHECEYAIKLAKKKLMHDLENNIEPFKHYLPIPYERRREKSKDWRKGDYWVLFVQLHKVYEHLEHYKGWAEAIRESDRLDYRDHFVHMNW